MLLIAGNTVLDWIAGPVEELAWDTTVWPATFTETLGGNGAVTAYAAALLGARVRLLTAFGDDAPGAFCAVSLADAGVDVHRVNASTGATAITFGLFRPDGARALVHRPGVLADAFADMEDLASLAPPQTNWLHIANPYSVPGLRRRSATYLRHARRRGWQTSMDAGWDRQGEWLAVAAPCLPELDWFFANRDEARRLTGIDNTAAAAQSLLDAGARGVVIKKGADGCLVATADGHFEIPGQAVTVVDTTGAGDAFCGGFLAAMQRGLPAVEAARVANLVGADSVSAAGGVNGLSDWPSTV